VFRSIAKDQRQAVAKDLNLFLDKFEKNTTPNNALAASSFTSKGVSPSKQS
jgi:hypothetical protein